MFRVQRAAAVRLLKMFNNTFGAAMPFDEFSAGPIYYLDEWIAHVVLLRISCPKRDWGIDSGETSNGVRSDSRAQTVSSLS
jgi:hypothetical protein